MTSTYYKVLVVEDSLTAAARTLTIQVQEMMEKNAGWQPLGGVSITSTNTHLIRMAQAMILQQ